jgi:Flp pilus assembly protein TadG
MISLRMGDRRGFVLVMMGLTAFALFGITGLAVDIGRMYIAKNEAQTFADAGAMIAGLSINGTASGIMTTAQLLAADSNRYNIGNSSFADGNVVLRYSTTQNGPWVTPGSAIGAPGNIKFAQVTATAAVPLYFLPVLIAQTAASVPAVAVSSQINILATAATHGIGTGLFPFAPVASAPADATGNYGYAVGSYYTLEWGTQTDSTNQCQDGVVSSDSDAMKTAADNFPNQYHGYFDGAPGNSSSVPPYQPATISGNSNITNQIINDWEAAPMNIGDVAPLIGGERRVDVTGDMQTRIAQDSDPNAATYASYTGNGRRVITVPVVCEGPCTYYSNGQTITSSHADTVIGYAGFFLNNNFPSKATQGYCAEYIGSVVQGNAAGQGNNPGGPGVFHVRLVQ